ncbi:MAG TPA: helix-turn-helix domain-containing protein [Polyangiaceae bacterium]|nr:helix-turn-helix domain-containing protein [Polyangiaceae bacterium]
MRESNSNGLEAALRAIVREELLAVLGEATKGRPEPPKWLSMTALAEQLGISVPTLKGLVNNGLPHIQPGEYKRFCLVDCEAWLRERSRKVGG